jgi:hypothetical protein
VVEAAGHPGRRSQSNRHLQRAADRHRFPERKEPIGITSQRVGALDDLIEVGHAVRIGATPGASPLTALRAQLNERSFNRLSGCGAQNRHPGARRRAGDDLDAGERLTLADAQGRRPADGLTNRRRGKRREDELTAAEVLEAKGLGGGKKRRLVHDSPGDAPVFMAGRLLPEQDDRGGLERLSVDG